MTKTLKEIYISIDIETAGPNPGTYSMLSIGACSVFNPEESFYIEIQPINDNFVPEAIEVCGLDMKKLQESGLPAKEAMSLFLQWLGNVVPRGGRPIFVALNAPFDWMFVNDYFHRFLGQNPFGHNAIDIKAYYMGLTNCSWREANIDSMMATLNLDKQALTHHALQDARDQAKIFRGLLAEQPTVCDH